MDQYIQQLLNQNQRVIVPGFGAFMSSTEGGIVYNQFLNFDDGALSGMVAEKEGVSADEAKQKVQSFVDALKQQLDNGETVSLEGIGTLKRNNESVEFTADSNASTSGVNIDIVQAVADASKSEAASEPEVKVVPSSDYSYQYDDDEDRKRKKWLVVILIALLFLVCIFLCLFVINKDNCVYNFFFGEEETKVEQVVAPTTVAPADTTTVEDAAPAEEDSHIVKIASDKRYNIIVGTYNNEAAAANRVKQLKEKGFDNAAVGTFRDNYVAIIDSYDRLPDAEARQEYIVDTYRIESYITNSGE